MRLVTDDDVLATEVEIADSLIAKARGLMFRRSIPEDYALVFPFDTPERRSVHMVFVPFPITVVWLVDERVERVERLPAWTGLAWGRADTLIELPADRAATIEEGDRIRFEEST